MENSRLFKLLNSLSPVEFSDFGGFVRSQYFNQSEKLVKLYEFLKDFYPDFKGAELERHRLFEVMYPGETYVHEKLRDRFSLMVRLAERHAAYLEFRRDASENKLYLAKSLSRKNPGGLSKTSL